MPERAPHLVLVGMMGSGKTTVGKRLARALGRPFVDSDREVEVRAGATVSEVFARDGEAAFRRLEAAVIADLLAADEPAVIATGGGAVVDAGTRARLAARAVVVWLRASPRTLANRVRPDGSRPLLADDPAAALHRLAEERAPWYEEVAAVTVDVDRLTRPKVVAAVLDAVAGRGIVADLEGAR